MSVLSIPQAPTNLNAVVLTITSIRLTWNASALADGYYVYRLIGGQWVRITNTLVTGLLFDDTGLNPNTQYFYRVTAVNKCGESPYIADDATTTCTQPEQPVGLFVNSTTGTSVTLGWTVTATPPVPRYQILYGTSSPPTLTPTGSPTAYGANSFTVSGLTPNTLYYFRIIADNGCDTSIASDIVSATTTCTLPAQVPYVNATVISYHQINLVWGSVSGSGITYTVQRRLPPSNTWTTLQSGIAVTSYQDTTVLAATEYCYQVRAVNSCGNGAFSPETCRTTPSAPACGAPEQTFNWEVQRDSEPGYAPGGGNAPNYISYSPQGSIDISDALIQKVQFSADSELDDILIMYHPDDDLVQTFITGPDADGRGTTHYQLPNRYLMFGNTSGHYVNQDRINGSGEIYTRCSSEKRFSVTGGPNHTVVAGAPCGTGLTGDGEIEDFEAKGFETAYFNQGVTKQRLIDLGFVGNDGVFEFKFAHILCGAGHVYIRNMTCDLIPNPPSSSSSSANPCPNNCATCCTKYTFVLSSGTDEYAINGIYNFVDDEFDNSCDRWHVGGDPNVELWCQNGFWRARFLACAGNCTVEFKSSVPNSACPPTSGWTIDASTQAGCNAACGELIDAYSVTVTAGVPCQSSSSSHSSSSSSSSSRSSSTSSSSSSSSSSSAPALSSSSGCAILDTFTRANNTTSMGITNTGQAWRDESGDWGIISNTAYVATPTGDDGATVQSGTNNVEVSAIIANVDGAFGVTARAIDANNYIVWYYESGSLAFWTRVGGSWSLLDSVAATVVNGDRIMLKTNSSTLTGYHNGTQVLSVTNSSLFSATRCGLYSYGSGNIRFDNFCVKTFTITQPPASSSSSSSSSGSDGSSSSSGGPLGIARRAMSTSASCSYNGNCSEFCDQLEISPLNSPSFAGCGLGCDQQNGQPEWDRIIHKVPGGCYWSSFYDQNGQSNIWPPTINGQNVGVELSQSGPCEWELYFFCYNSEGEPSIYWRGACMGASPYGLYSYLGGCDSGATPYVTVMCSN